jgi:glycogen debranching enzyme
MLKRYLDWWFDARQDSNTGLITAVFEETFIPYLGCAGEYAPVDTNVEVYVGCHYVEALARELGFFSDAEKENVRKGSLKKAINKYLWNDKKGAYYPYFINEMKQGDCLMASTFYPLRFQIAPKERQKRLLELLTDNDIFNWDNIPITSVSKKDAVFVATIGGYQGNASWSGNVWTLINEMVVRGLCDCGENDLAAELALKTLYAFNHNCSEFISPFDGVGHGVLQYAWTASQYLELLVESIFGLDYDAKNKTVMICPRIPGQIANEKLQLLDLQISDGVFADITVNGKDISGKISNESIKIHVRSKD